MSKKEKKIPDMSKFAVLIFCWGRPQFHNTLDALRKHGYTGRVIMLLDNLDKTNEEYIRLYGNENTYVFNKNFVARKCDPMNNFGNMDSTLYVENAMFDAAKDLGLEYFVAMCDDYESFSHKREESERRTRRLDEIFYLFVEYLINTPIKSIAFSQGGDHIGGFDPYRRQSKRKVMNSFFCVTDRPFKFYGSMNDDANMYIQNGIRGDIFLTFYPFMLHQPPTQNVDGGLSDLYKKYGTYVKSFYSVMLSPSSVVIKLMGHTSPRLHHKIDYKKTMPCIIDEKYKKI